MSTEKQNEAAPALSCSRMVSVRLRLSRENMEYLHGIIEMCLDSDEPRFRRVARTVSKTISQQLSKTQPQANNPDDLRSP